MKQQPLLCVENLSVAFGKGEQANIVVSGVSFTLRRGETLALVGESGSGKTMTGRALMQILPKGAAPISGSANFAPDETKDAKDLLAMNNSQIRNIRGGKISMIFQEPMSSLSPLHTIGAQVGEAVSLHTGLRGAAIKARCLEVFDHVGFPDPERAWHAFPFELSGGLRQRAMIAMAMACKPDIVIADEPTTALDVTTQAQVLDLIERLQAETGMAMLIVTHDLGVVANVADRVCVMRKGEVVEAGPCDAVLSDPQHGYTKALIAAAPEPPMDDLRVGAGEDDPIFWCKNLNKTYQGRVSGLGKRAPQVHAVRDVNLTLGRGETLAVVGESGSGKTTVAKLMLRAENPDEGGEIGFCGKDGKHIDLAELSGSRLKSFRRRAQMVFQDPFSALSPRMSVGDILTEPMKVHGLGTRRQRLDRASHLMQRVGLSPDHLGRYPHAFSGGQRQRIAIARALALGPELLVCDEPTSALDVSVQAQVLELLKELRDEMGLSYLFISHDLKVVADLADRVAVMRRGRVVEEATAAKLFSNPVHPYTKALIAASPEPDPARKLDLAKVALGAGEPESWEPAFRFHGESAPPMREIAPGHFVRSVA